MRSSSPPPTNGDGCDDTFRDDTTNRTNATVSIADSIANHDFAARTSTDRNPAFVAQNGRPPPASRNVLALSKTELQTLTADLADNFLFPAQTQFNFDVAELDPQNLSLQQPVLPEPVFEERTQQLLVVVGYFPPPSHYRSVERTAILITRCIPDNWSIPEGANIRSVFTAAELKSYSRENTGGKEEERKPAAGRGALRTLQSDPRVHPTAARLRQGSHLHTSSGSGSGSISIRSDTSEESTDSSTETRPSVVESDCNRSSLSPDHSYTVLSCSHKMVGKKSGRALLREEGLERTDNNLDLTTWPQVNMINQKNYYTEFLKRDDQYLAYRTQHEEARNRMVREARDKDRALAQGMQTEDVAEEGDETTLAIEPQGGYASKLIVLHVGSQNLRIGLGTDALPKTVPMVIARKSSKSESEEDDGEPSPKRIKLDGVVPDAAYPEKWFGDDFANQYQAMCSELRTRMRANKRRVLPNSKELVVNFNRRTPPDVISEHNDVNHIDWTQLPPDPKDAPDHITGNAALRIPDNSKPRYKLFWPIRYGTFNEKDYSDRNQIYHDIAKIFEEAFKSQIGITRLSELANYNCVFIIPDLYERVYVNMMLDILFRDLGLGKVCLQQESLSATFGAGYSISCIVDIGAQKTSICCVDEGLCIEESRVNLKMGGADVTETFIKMMLHDHFPYGDINLKRRYDLLLAEELKQKFCSMDENAVAVQTYDFHLRAPGQDTRRYQFKTYDETMLSAMGLFKPAIFDHSERLKCRRQIIPRSVDLYDGSPNDPLSQAQLLCLDIAAANLPTTNGTHEASNGPTVASTPSRPAPLNLLSRLNEAEGTPRSSIAGSPAPEGTPNPDGEAPAAGEADQPLVFRDPVLEKTKQAEARDKILPVVPLDQAILESLAQGARGDDRKLRDFFGGIMLIGGGSKIPNFGNFLELRLRELRPFYGKEILIGPPPRELDPQVLVWKGGSVFGKLSSSGNDAWINRTEYDVLGSRLLVNKCMFPW